MTAPDTAHGLTVERTYDASPKRVFSAWTTPDLLRRWYAPVDGWVVSRVEIEPRVGGHYEIAFGPAPDGDRYTERGVYEAIEPMRLLRWRLELVGDTIERTTVEVTFTATGARAHHRIRLLHGRDRSRARRRVVRDARTPRGRPRVIRRAFPSMAPAQHRTYRVAHASAAAVRTPRVAMTSTKCATRASKAS